MAIARIDQHESAFRARSASNCARSIARLRSRSAVLMLPSLESLAGSRVPTRRRQVSFFQPPVRRWLDRWAVRRWIGSSAHLNSRGHGRRYTKPLACPAWSDRSRGKCLTASAAHCVPLQQRRAFAAEGDPLASSYPGPLLASSFRFFLMSFPTDEAGMGTDVLLAVPASCRPVAALPDLCLAVRNSLIPTTFRHQDACAFGVAQDTHSGRSSQRPEHRGSPGTAGRKTQALFFEGHFQSGTPRANPRKRLEEVSDRISDLCVGTEHHVPAWS